MALFDVKGARQVVTAELGAASKRLGRLSTILIGPDRLVVRSGRSQTWCRTWARRRWRKPRPSGGPWPEPEPPTIPGAPNLSGEDLIAS